jgi:putative oxidoreductase
MTDWGLLILRVALGLVFLAHGWPKLNPNGPMKGPAGVAGFFKQVGIPAPLLAAWVVALLETAGAVLLIVGLATRLLGLAFAIDMLVAILLVVRKHKGFTTTGGAGWEFEFILGAAALALALTGAGSIALDPALGM